MGVHYWNDHDFGMSLATVRIWIHGVLAEEIPGEGPGTTLIDKDMWEVATIDWPSGEVTLLTTDSGGPMVISDYENPFFPSP